MLEITNHNPHTHLSLAWVSFLACRLSSTPRLWLGFLCGCEKRQCLLRKGAGLLCANLQALYGTELAHALWVLISSARTHSEIVHLSAVPPEQILMEVQCECWA